MAIGVGIPVDRSVEIVIPATVFAIGNDAKFIIAMQHPSQDQGRGELNRSVTNYWIVRVDDGVVFGPLTEASFKMQRLQLGVSVDLGFSRVHEDLR